MKMYTFQHHNDCFRYYGFLYNFLDWLPGYIKSIFKFYNKATVITASLMNGMQETIKPKQKIIGENTLFLPAGTGGLSDAIRLRIHHIDRFSLYKRFKICDCDFHEAGTAFFRRPRNMGCENSAFAAQQGVILLNRLG